MQNGNRKGIAQWSKTYAGKKFYTSILFLALPIILLVTFTFIPALDMVIFSFQNRDPYGTNPTYAGFSNYVTIFTDKDYLETFKNSLYYLVGSFIQQALALLLASILCSKIRAKGLFKGILFFPYLMNGVAVSIIFQRFFLKGQKGLTPDGTLNTILTTLGLDPILWFDVDKPFLANCCLVFISIWKYIGFDIIMYIGAIQSISPDLYEAADLDGANPWQNFIYRISKHKAYHLIAAYPCCKGCYLSIRDTIYHNKGHDGHYHIRYQDYQHSVLAEKGGSCFGNGYRAAYHNDNRNVYTKILLP